jgi:hypothetical protein
MANRNRVHMREGALSDVEFTEDSNPQGGVLLVDGDNVVWDHLVSHGILVSHKKRDYPQSIKMMRVIHS